MVVRVCNAEHEDGGGGGIQVAEIGMGAERRFRGAIGGDARRGSVFFCVGTCADGAVGLHFLKYFDSMRLQMH